MLKLEKAEAAWLGSIASIDPKDDRPFLLAGVRVKFAPISRGGVRAAHASSRAALQADLDDKEEAGDQYSIAMLSRGIVAWEGVGDADGKVLPVTPESVALALDDPDFFAAADRAYVLPYALRSAEKNGLSVSPSGIGEAGTAARATARRPASRKRANAAKPAPIPSTRSKRPKGKTSGTS